MFTNLIFRLIVPVSMIICCDIMSYMFGFFFGKTPLIKLSPKKTWEGFIGGAFSTVLFGILVSCSRDENVFGTCPVLTNLKYWLKFNDYNMRLYVKFYHESVNNVTVWQTLASLLVSRRYSTKGCGLHTVIDTSAVIFAF